MRTIPIATGILAFLLSIAPGCRDASPEAQVRRAFEACVESIEEQDAAPVFTHLHPRFRGPEGMGPDEARLYLTGLLHREKIGITVISDRIEAEPDRAHQSVELLLTSRTGDALLPQDGSHRQFLLQWVRQEDRWLLRSLEETKPQP